MVQQGAILVWRYGCPWQVVIVNNQALSDKVGYRECAMSCLLREVVCLGTEVMVGAGVSHCKMQMIEVVVCSVIGSCEWGLRF